MKLLYTILGIMLGATSVAYGASVLFPYQGGTGIGSATAGDVGKYIKVSDDSPFTYTFDSPAGGSGTFSWTPTSYGVSTSTTLGFLNGFLSAASSTFRPSPNSGCASSEPKFSPAATETHPTIPA